MYIHISHDRGNFSYLWVNLLILNYAGRAEENTWKKLRLEQTSQHFVSKHYRCRNIVYSHQISLQFIPRSSTVINLALAKVKSCTYTVSASNQLNDDIISNSGKAPLYKVCCKYLHVKIWTILSQFLAQICDIALIQIWPLPFSDICVNICWQELIFLYCVAHKIKKHTKNVTRYWYKC